jgi:hypothetical protein
MSDDEKAADLGDWSDDPGEFFPVIDNYSCPDCGRETCTGEDCYWPDEAGLRRG